MTYFWAMLISAVIVILREFSKTFTCGKCKKDDLLKCDVKWQKDVRCYLCDDCLRAIEKAKDLLEGERT